eukprot:TRINITY_DN8620_c0_g2_i1.p1 TRINITY_DN8620_c0_g2~~TRINITY_DN8620_c0_g2_i1.p1  ORF type:complete len:633 (+),score=141.77 TRINITY_DN8620_c0_g2_i1:136-2034(+)
MPWEEDGRRLKPTELRHYLSHRGFERTEPVKKKTDWLSKLGIERPVFEEGEKEFKIANFNHSVLAELARRDQEAESESETESSESEDSFVSVTPELVNPYYEGCGHRIPCPTREAIKILLGTQFFADFEDVFPGAVATLASRCYMQKAKAGEVLFRQGDPSEDCYIIMLGQVGVYISAAEQRSPRGAERVMVEDQRRMSIISIQSITSEDKVVKCFKSLMELIWGAKEEIAPVRKPKVEWKLELPENRSSTTEGANSFNNRSKLGDRVVLLKAKAVFGEYGLMSDKPRAATVKCEGDCTFLAIRKQDFVKLFGDGVTGEELQKRVFLQCVPGFVEHNQQLKEKVGKIRRRRPSMAENLEYGRIDGRMELFAGLHPSELFKETSIAKGEDFIKQGDESSHDIFVVKSGIVTFYRMLVPFPHKCFQARDKVRKMDKQLTAWCTMKAGDVFCSLGAFGLENAKECFTVRSDTPLCSVFKASVKELREVAPNIVKAVLEKCADNMKSLLHFSGGYRSLLDISSCGLPESRVKLVHECCTADQMLNYGYSSPEKIQQLSQLRQTAQVVPFGRSFPEIQMSEAAAEERFKRNVSGSSVMTFSLFGKNHGLELSPAPPDPPPFPPPPHGMPHAPAQVLT